MKIIIISIGLLLGFSGCATKNVANLNLNESLSIIVKPKLVQARINMTSSIKNDTKYRRYRAVVANPKRVLTIFSDSKFHYMKEVFITPQVMTQYGPRQLRLFVDSSEVLSKFKMSKLLNIRNNFLKPGKNNDIYDYVSGLLGVEYSSKSYDGVINIFLHGFSDERTLGFFDPLDLRRQSQKTVCLHLNSRKIFSKADNVNPSLVVLHEFQHLINFYQRRVVNPSNYAMNISMNEFLSTSFEIIFAREVKSNHWRTDFYGNRLYFNQTIFSYLDDTNIGLDDWESTYSHYGKLQALVLFLNKHYNLKQIVSGMIKSPYIDSTSLLIELKKQGYNSNSLVALLKIIGAGIKSKQLGIYNYHRVGSYGKPKRLSIFFHQ